MNMKNIGMGMVWLAVGATLALAPGCGASVEGTPEVIDLGSNDRVQQVSSDKTPLEGRWTLACSQLPAGGFGKGESQFKGNRYTNLISVYSDAGCAQFVMEAQESGLFSIPAAGKINFNAPSGGVSYNVFEVAQGTLYFGAESAETEAARPATVSKALAYKYAGAPALTVEASN